MMDDHPAEHRAPRPARGMRNTTYAQPLAHLHFWHRIPGVRSLEDMLRFFSPFERLLLYVFATLLALSSAFLLASLNSAVTVEVPADGGSLTEGVIGTPRFINPLLAISDADRDLTQLVYSGLMRANKDGTLVPDLASRYEISEDGLQYTFTIRENATFHDGTPVTATDVIFTISSAQTPEIKSPKRADWEGVTAEALNEKTVRFTLPRPYAPFLENTTIGILPEHRWSDVTPEEFPFHQLNTRPVGSGPYALSAVRTDASGAPTRYALRAFDAFTLGAPHLSHIIFRFYPSEADMVDALKSGEIESAPGISPRNIAELPLNSHTVERTTLPRVFAVFLNQNQAPIFAEKAVREALNAAVAREEIIEAGLSGYGTPIDGPIPPGILSTQSIPPLIDTMSQSARREEARDILAAAGWELDESQGVWEDGDTTLAFSLATADTPELIATAAALVESWRALGADVSLEIFSTSDLSTGVIRPREYQALLFGEIVGRTLDLFAFWHSSQRTDPGLNLALYTNSSADSLLSDARAETDRGAREEMYVEFTDVVAEDVPAVFLYAPDFVYVVPGKLDGVALGALTTPSERFLNVHQWHTEVERVWDIFAEPTQRSDQ